MQPYQKAGEEITRQKAAPAKALGTLASVGGAALGTGLVSKFAQGSLAAKAAPFLSDYIPEDLAMKGLSKADPRLGKFAKLATEYGNSFDSVKKFIGDKITKENPKLDKNIIQQYSPELFEFLNGEIQKGRSALEAGAIAQTQGKFKNIIKKIADDHKTPFASILQTVFGEGQGQAQQQNQQQQQPQQGGEAKQQLLQAMQSLSQQLRQ